LGGLNVVILLWLMIVIVMGFIMMELIEGVSSSLTQDGVDEEWIAPLAAGSLMLLIGIYIALN
jgi:hypothetical protein